MGAMGFGIPAAIGAALARPGLKVAAFLGDGGAQMTSEELIVAVERKLPIVFLVFRNSSLGLVRQMQTHSFGGRYFATDIASPESRSAGIVPSMEEFPRTCVQDPLWAGVSVGTNPAGYKPRAIEEARGDPASFSEVTSLHTPSHSYSLHPTVWDPTVASVTPSTETAPPWNDMSRPLDAAAEDSASPIVPPEAGDQKTSPFPLSISTWALSSSAPDESAVDRRTATATAIKTAPIQAFLMPVMSRTPAPS
jgi:hypothetical protein